MAAAAKQSKRRPHEMTDEHKASLAAGRNEARAVKAYLQAIEGAPKKRGRQRTVDGIKRRLAAIDATMADASALVRLQLVQEKADLEAELASKTAGSNVDLDGLRKAFVKVARSYSERKGISYASWRAVGVDATTLKEAGITRG
jgi:hypothetical protein